MSQQSKAIKVQDTHEYQQKRIQILKEINSNKIDIDKNIFKHSLNEKLELKRLKKAFIDNSKEFKDYLISKILKSPLICGDLKLSVV